MEAPLAPCSETEPSPHGGVGGGGGGAKRSDSGRDAMTDKVLSPSIRHPVQVSEPLVENAKQFPPPEFIKDHGGLGE